MQTHKKFSTRLPVKMDLAHEKLPGQSLVEVLGTDRVIVENYQSIVKYEPCEICIKTSSCAIRINGRAMELARMAGDQLIVVGNIAGISFEKRGR